MHDNASTPFAKRKPSLAMIVALLEAGAIILQLLSVTDSAQSQEPGARIVFEKDILPILTAHCFKCHGFEARKAGLDLRSVGTMLAGGDNGPVIVQSRGRATDSTLYQRIADRSMPPEQELPLEKAKIDLIRLWLDEGAATNNTEELVADAYAPAISEDDRKFWAFQKPERPFIPKVHHLEHVRSPVDSFVLEKLEEKSLSYSPEAGRNELIRRASFDLLGLPPSRDHVEAFLADSDDSAYERMIDRLLSSPHFGERWGRHWLDAAGYVDTIGDDTDAAIAKVSAGKWKYRDYVVRAFNEDKPFDRFLIEQLAGDELIDWQSAETLTPDMQQLLIATGLLRTAADETLQNELNTADIRQAVLEHTMEVVAGNLLGLTVNCARCHSHKFDPIPQEDYYRLLAIFSPAFNPQSWLQPAQRELPDISKSEKAKADAANAAIDKQVGQCNSKIGALKKPYEDRIFAAKLALLPEAIRTDTETAIETPTDKRSEVQKYLAKKFEPELKPKPAEVIAAFTPAEKTQYDAWNAQIGQLNSQRRTWGTIQAVYDVGPPSPTYLLRRGNLDRPGKQVPPGFLRVLCESEALSRVEASTPNPHASGRRLALARWLTDRSGAAAGLVARVYVNRVWQYLFGEGIVATSENLGNSGARPTHRELLDWLAVEFQSNWQIKPLMRLIVTSSVYRQSSRREEQKVGSNGSVNEIVNPENADPANHLLWRMRLRQIESECVRDAMLCASGNLQMGIGGPPTMIEGKPDGTVVVKKGGPPDGFIDRRSVYVLGRRRYNLSLLEAFDQPELTSNCTRRNPSAVVAQSLTMLNDDFVLAQAAGFAKRVRHHSPDVNVQVEYAFHVALARSPDKQELAWAIELLSRQAERYMKSSVPPDEAAQKALGHLCQMLFNTNEFLYLP